ncbi:hypothetical protein J5Y06_14775 [Tianweitania sediminis]|uniref:Uncharacterized protein n=2 Tax=Tianweitania sediminis TaxID=1502156 RepID=A0A8J7UKJ2_9HYPH|nr:hypothetical protein [Tianweitania sediminis]
MIGMSTATVRSYGTRAGNIPAQAIDALEWNKLMQAIEAIAERYGSESITIGGPRP